MLKRFIAKFRPSPAMAVALLGLVVALGGAGWAANGGAFILGVFNSATQKTALVANFNGSALQVSNTSAAASAVPLQLTAAAGHPPMKINTTTRVTNLNADYIDGLDASTQLTRVMRIPFTLAPGTSSASIALPSNLPVHLLGVYPADHFQGLAQVTLFSSNTQIGQSILWIGAHSRTTEPVPDGGSGVVGDHIVYLDTVSSLEVQSNGGSAIRVHNNASAARSGEITLMW